MKKDEKLEFWIDPILPKGKVILFAGSSGAGKTTCMFQIADALQKGKAEVAGFPCSGAARVVYVTGDKDGETYDALSARMGIAPIPSVNLLDLAAQRGLEADQVSLPWLWAEIKKDFAWHPNVVIMDPPDLLLDIGNFNDKRSVAQGFFKLWRWAIQHDVTVVLVMHTNKARNDEFTDLFHRVAGSHALLAYAHTKAMLFTPAETGEPYFTALVRGQHFGEITVPLRRDGARMVVTNPSLHLPDKYPLLDCFTARDEVLTFTELVERAKEFFGMARTSVYRQLRELLDQGFVVQTAYGKYQLSPSYTPTIQ